MKLNEIQQLILIGAVADLGRLQAMPEPYFIRHDQRLVDERTAIWDAREGIVRCQPAEWLNANLEDGALRQRISRAYKKLILLGLVERAQTYLSGTNVTHLRPTEAGITLARSLTTKEPE